MLYLGTLRELGPLVQRLKISPELRFLTTMTTKDVKWGLHDIETREESIPHFDFSLMSSPEAGRFESWTLKLLRNASTAFASRMNPEHLGQLCCACRN
jgi:hypothetical protein